MSLALECADCGIAFCLPYQVYRDRLRDHKTFYCPNGHPNYYPQQTAEEVLIQDLRKRIRNLEEQRDRFRGFWHGASLQARQCPVLCGWRSGAGIDRAPQSIRRHLQKTHGIVLPDLSVSEKESA